MSQQGIELIANLLTQCVFVDSFECFELRVNNKMSKVLGCFIKTVEETY